MQEVTVEQNKWRARYMTCLYLWDKRYLTTHPQHGLMTGLHIKFNSHHDYGTRIYISKEEKKPHNRPTMTHTKYFRRIAEGLDVEPLLQLLDAKPELWKEIETRFWKSNRKTS